MIAPFVLAPNFAADASGLDTILELALHASILALLLLASFKCRFIFGDSSFPSVSVEWAAGLLLFS